MQNGVTRTEFSSHLKTQVIQNSAFQGTRHQATKDVNRDQQLPSLAPGGPREPQGWPECGPSKGRMTEPERTEPPGERIPEACRPLYLADGGSAHMRKEVPRSQRPGRTTQEGTGAAVRAHGEPGADGNLMTHGAQQREWGPCLSQSWKELFPDGCLRRSSRICART